MALISKPLNTIVTAVQETRHPGLSILIMGTIVAILYYGRVFFITWLAALTIAFILEPFVALLMRIRFPRSLASFWPEGRTRPRRRGCVGIANRAEPG